MINLQERMTTEEFLRQWNKHMLTVAKAMKRTYKLSNEDVEDIVQDVTIRLLKLTPEQQERGGAWIRTVINNASRDALDRIIRATRNTYSIDEPLNDDSTGTYKDSFVAPQDDEHDTRQKLLIGKLLSSCDRFAQHLIKLRLGFDGKDPMSYEDIAALFNTTPDKIQEVIENGYASIKRECGGVFEQEDSPLFG